MKSVYVAGPYSYKGPYKETIMQKRYEALTNYSAWLINSGEYVVFSPITHSRPLITSSNHISAANYTWDFWKKQDLWFLSRCDEIHILMLEGWEESVGVTAEIEFAKKNGKSMRYVDPSVCGF